MIDKVYGTVDGKIVTEQNIEALVKNAEEGFPHVYLHKIGRPRLGKEVTETVAVRLSPAQIHALDTQATAYGISRSELIRKVIAAHLAA